jgi:threonine/homoserine/homoserine lactone efflux protein
MLDALVAFLPAGALLASLVSRARAALVRGTRRLETVSGAAMIGFAIKLAADAR